MTEKKTTFKDLPQELRESANRIWLAGLGALSTAEKEGSKLFHNLVHQGETYEAKGREAVVDAKETVEEKVDQAKTEAAGLWGGVESRIDEAVTSSFRRFGVPTRDEIATLTRRVEELTNQVERIATGTVAAAEPAAKKATTRKPAAKKATTKTAAAKKTTTRKTAAKKTDTKATAAKKTAAKAKPATPPADPDAVAAKISATDTKKTADAHASID